MSLRRSVGSDSGTRPLNRFRPSDFRGSRVAILQFGHLTFRPASRDATFSLTNEQCGHLKTIIAQPNWMIPADSLCRAPLVRLRGADTRSVQTANARLGKHILAGKTEKCTPNVLF